METFLKKIAASLICLLALPNCVGGSSGQISLPKNAQFGMWTSLPIDQVARCIATQTGGTLDGSNVVGPSGVRYAVGPARDGSAYPTQISRFGPDTPANEAKVIDCTIASK
jgi:hypothetical protein